MHCVNACATVFLQHVVFACWVDCAIKLMAICWMWQVLRMVVSTYQAASGAGAAAMEELKLQTKEVQFFPPSLY